MMLMYLPCQLSKSPVTKTFSPPWGQMSCVIEGFPSFTLSIMISYVRTPYQIPNLSLIQTSVCEILLSWCSRLLSCCIATTTAGIVLVSTGKADFSTDLGTTGLAAWWCGLLIFGLLLTLRLLACCCFVFLVVMSLVFPAWGFWREREFLCVDQGRGSVMQRNKEKIIVARLLL